MTCINEAGGVSAGLTLINALGSLYLLTDTCLCYTVISWIVTGSLNFMSALICSLNPPYMSFDSLLIDLMYESAIELLFKLSLLKWLFVYRNLDTVFGAFSPLNPYDSSFDPS